ncbi:diguanylate cyclase [Acholeplasma vituli]|uniref:Diguanylate cyclase n=1 Tax=Paracholeplasma vituli TaxID=69473 RepID=A0ABT2PXA0_9MOLU|nr:diguanylate cyclase [Paracholeplasma vituli]MCU0105585.1 diguanylate cyclase [Paracholeplasma vituli]
MRLIKTYKPYIILLVVTIIFLSLFWIGYDSLRISIDTPQKLTAEWVFENESISVPTKLNVSTNTPYRIYRTLDQNFNESQVIMIRTSLQNITVYLDDVLIYEKQFGTSQFKPYASSWHFITLPGQNEGHELSIELSSPYRSMSGEINDVFYGSEVMHYRYLMNTYGIRLIIGVILFLIGLIVMIFDFLVKQVRDKGYVYIGLFAIILSLWVIAESRMLQFFTGSELLMGTLAYMSLPAFAIPMIVFLTEFLLKDYKKVLSWMKYLFIIHLVIITVLHYLNIADYFETVLLSQIWIAVGIVLAIIALILDNKKNNQNETIKALYAFIVLMVFAILEFINFQVGFFENVSLYLSLGIVLIMTYVIINYFRYIIQRLKISFQTELYQKLAYMDHVIQGKNRLAFERDFDAIMRDEKQSKDLRLILFDLDNLKKINDVHGHIAGDEAIKTAYDMISAVFKDYGECYRIGGDEFACLYLNKSHDLYSDKLSILESLETEYNTKSVYRFGISLGSAVMDNDGMGYTELYEQADHMMYDYRKQKHLK